MKKFLSLTLAAALILAMLTACGCSANVSTHPGGMITEETTRPSIMPTPTATHETTRPTEMTRPHATMPTQDGSTPTDNMMPDGTTGRNTNPTDTTAENRSHRAMPSR